MNNGCYVSCAAYYSHILQLFKCYIHVLLEMEAFFSRELSPQQISSLLTLELCVCTTPATDKPQNCYVIITSKELLITDSSIPPKCVAKRLDLSSVVSITCGKEKPLFLEKKYQESSTHIEIVFESFEKKKTTLLDSPFIQRALTLSKSSPRANRIPSSSDLLNPSVNSSPVIDRNKSIIQQSQKAPSTDTVYKARLRLDVFTLKANSTLLEFMKYALQNCRIYSLLSSCSASREAEYPLPQTSVEALFDEIKTELMNAKELTKKFSICRELIYAAQQYTHIYTLFWKDTAVLSRFLVELQQYLMQEVTPAVPNNRADEMEFVILLMTGIKHCMNYPCTIQLRATVLNSNVSLLKSIIQLALTDPCRPDNLGRQAVTEFNQLRIEYFRESLSLLTSLTEISMHSSWILNKPTSLSTQLIASTIESLIKPFFIVFSSLLRSFISLLSDATILNLDSMLSLYTFLKLVEFLHSSSRAIWGQITKSFSEELRYYLSPSLLSSRLNSDRPVSQDIMYLSNWLHSSLKQHI